MHTLIRCVRPRQCRCTDTLQVHRGIRSQWRSDPVFIINQRTEKHPVSGSPDSDHPASSATPRSVRNLAAHSTKHRPRHFRAHAWPHTLTTQPAYCRAQHSPPRLVHIALSAPAACGAAARRRCDALATTAAQYAHKRQCP